MGDEPKFKLSVGADRLTNALQHRHPNLSDGEIEELGNAMLEKLSDSIIAGDQLASIRRRADGKVELRVWEIGGKGDK